MECVRTENELVAMITKMEFNKAIVEQEVIRLNTGLLNPNAEVSFKFNVIN